MDLLLEGKEEGKEGRRIEGREEGRKEGKERRKRRKKGRGQASFIFSLPSRSLQGGLTTAITRKAGPETTGRGPLLRPSSGLV
jgi:hypothetical protein